MFSAAPANHFALGLREADGLTDKHGIGSAVNPKIQNAASENVFLEFLVLCAVVRRMKPDSELYVDGLLCRIPCIFKFKGNGKQCENKGPFVFGLVPQIGDALYRVLEALLDDQKSYRILTGVLPDRDFSEKLFNLPTIRRKIDAAIPETFSETEREQVRLFFYQGGYAVIRDWLNRDERESPKKLSAFLNGIIEKMLQF